MSIILKKHKTETLSRLITIEAETEAEALTTVEESYGNGDIILDYNDHINTDINTYKIEDCEE